MARASALGWGWSPEARGVTPLGGAGRCARAASQPRGCRSGPLQMGRSPGSLSDSGEESEPPPPERKGASAECDVGEVGRGMDARRSASGDIGVASRLCEARGAGACVAERDLPGALPAGLGVGGLGGRWLEASAAHAVSAVSSRSPSALPCQGRRLACQGRGGAPPSPSLPWLFGLFLIRGRGRGRLRLRARFRV